MNATRRSWLPVLPMIAVAPLILPAWGTAHAQDKSTQDKGAQGKATQDKGPAPAAAAGSVPALITILEGQSSFIRGTEKLGSAEGVVLAPGDIIEVREGFMQVELSDGTLLGIGPKTSLMLESPAPRAPPGEKSVHLMRGWLKATGKTLPRLTSQPGRVDATSGSWAVCLVPGRFQFFAETAPARLTQSPGTKSEIQNALRPGDFFEQLGTAKATISPRPGGEFLTGLPRPFRDRLPARAERFVGRTVAPKKLGTVEYADIEAWLKGDLALRRSMIPRWRVLINEPNFRKQLAANVKDHPEWRIILDPPKPPPENPLVFTPDKRK